MEEAFQLLLYTADFVFYLRLKYEFQVITLFLYFYLLVLDFLSSEFSFQLSFELTSQECH